MVEARAWVGMAVERRVMVRSWALQAFLVTKSCQVEIQGPNEMAAEFKQIIGYLE